MEEQKATLEDYAAASFDPWQHSEDEWKPPSNTEWAELANPYLVTMRIAWLTMHKSKDELITMLDGMDEDIGSKMMNSFADTHNFFKGAVALLEGAEARILSAGAALIKREGDAQ